MCADPRFRRDGSIFGGGCLARDLTPRVQPQSGADRAAGTIPDIVFVAGGPVHDVDFTVGSNPFALMLTVPFRLSPLARSPARGRWSGMRNLASPL